MGSKAELDQAEQIRREEIVKQTKKMLLAHMHIEEQDESTMTACCHDYFLQLSFSNQHPLLVLCFARAMRKCNTGRLLSAVNELNMKSILGCHAVNVELGCYYYRITHWLDTAMSVERFSEILDRSFVEADRGYVYLLSTGP